MSYYFLGHVGESQVLFLLANLVSTEKGVSCNLRFSVYIDDTLFFWCQYIHAQNNMNFYSILKSKYKSLILINFSQIAYIF